MGAQSWQQVVYELCADPATGEGQMMGHQALKVGRKMFAFDVDGELVVKLGRDRVAALVAAGAATTFEPMQGRRMHDWAAVPEDSGDWVALAEEARALVASLGARDAR